MELSHEQDFLMASLWSLVKRRESSKKWARKNYKEHPEKMRKYARDWFKEKYKEDPTPFKKRQKAHYNAAPSKAKAQASAWSKENPEKRKAIHAKWIENNPDKNRQQKRNWQKANPENNKAKSSRRRAKKAGNGGSHTSEEWVQLKIQYGNRCLCCLRSEEELLKLGLFIAADHVQSIADGGTDDISNIQPLCHGKGGCNNTKGSKSIDYRGNI